MDEYIKPNPSRTALLTIDTQNDFTLPEAPAEIDGTAAVIPRMRRLVQTFRELARPIVHVVRLYRADGSNADRCRRRVIEAGPDIVRPGTTGAELVEGLTPDSNVELEAKQLLDGEFQLVGRSEWVMYKPRWGAFYRTDLREFLEERDVNTVVICGCNFPNCPRTTVYEASEREFRIVFVADATSGTYERGLRELADIGVVVEDTEWTIDWIT